MVYVCIFLKILILMSLLMLLLLLMMVMILLTTAEEVLLYIPLCPPQYYMVYTCPVLRPVQ